MSPKNGFLPNFFVMTFSVNGIKQENDQKYPVEMLVCVDAPLLARKILEEKNILILSIKEFTNDKEAFGDIYFTTQKNFQTITYVTKYTNIQEACEFFVFIGFELSSINSFATPIAEQESTALIVAAVQQSQKKKDAIQKEIQEKARQEKKVYEDANLESAKKIILKVFEKVDEAIKRGDGQIVLQDMKQITSLTEELKKLRMGTNFEKIKETIESLFVLVQKINNEYFDRIQNPQETISGTSSVTNIDVQREMERIEYVAILKSLGSKISLQNKDYALFGSGAMYRKFLQKDIGKRAKNLFGILYGAYDIVELIFLVAICLLGVYTLANEIYLFSINQFGLAYMLMSVGLRGMVIFAARYFRNKNIGRLLLIILVAILAHYLLMRVVTTNFAL